MFVLCTDTNKRDAVKDAINEYKNEDIGYLLAKDIHDRPKIELKKPDDKPSSKMVLDRLWYHVFFL